MKEFNIYNYQGCIPLSDFKNPPPEQVGCEKEKCPDCKKQMWVSDLKRKLRKEKNKILLCWYCFFNLCIKNNIDLRNAVIVNMLKMH